MKNEHNYFVKFIWVIIAIGLISWTAAMIYLIHKAL